MKKITKPCKLNAIRYKHADNEGSLSAIQLGFTNGYKMAMIEANDCERQGYETKTVKIDPN